jgi:uncharacterized protein YjiS (DUF1127 family)
LLILTPRKLALQAENIRPTEPTSGFSALRQEVPVAISQDTTQGLRRFSLAPDLAPARRFARWRRNLADWRRRRAYRRDLKRLLHVGEHMIRDIGLTPDDARRQIDKPFWRR